MEMNGGFDGLDEKTRNAFFELAQKVTLPAGETVFHEGMACANFLFVQHGSVKVRKTSEQGREIVLYRVESGQSCLLTSFCLMNSEQYNAEGITETPVSALVLPAVHFHSLLETSASFRQLVFRSLGMRISDLLVRIEEVAFRRVDVRLAQYLAQYPQRDLKITHQDLAVELGSVREVVSRQLKDFERKAWVGLHRGRIEILQRDQLRQFSK